MALGRAARGLAALCLGVLLLAGCTARAPRAQGPVQPPALADAQALALIDAWQSQLAHYVAEAGHGDPMVLARLPLQRATGTLRPSRVGFGVLDLDARVAEADGFDVQGLLLGPLAGDEPRGLVFIVGIVQRQGYRPLALVDLRPVTLQWQDGRLVASASAADATALARYRAFIDPALPLRFPSDSDDFELVRCADTLCVAERRSGARWQLGR